VFRRASSVLDSCYSNRRARAGGATQIVASLDSKLIWEKKKNKNELCPTVYATAALDVELEHFRAVPNNLLVGPSAQIVSSLLREDSMQ